MTGRGDEVIGGLGGGKNGVIIFGTETGEEICGSILDSETIKTGAIAEEFVAAEDGPCVGDTGSTKLDSDRVDSVGSTV